MLRRYREFNADERDGAHQGDRHAEMPWSVGRLHRAELFHRIVRAGRRGHMSGLPSGDGRFHRGRVHELQDARRNAFPMVGLVRSPWDFVAYWNVAVDFGGDIAGLHGREETAC